MHTKQCISKFFSFTADFQSRLAIFSNFTCVYSSSFHHANDSLIIKTRIILAYTDRKN